MQQGPYSVGRCKQGERQTRVAAHASFSPVSTRLWAEGREEVLSRFPLLAAQLLDQPHPPQEPTVECHGPDNSPLWRPSPEAGALPHPTLPPVHPSPNPLTPPPPNLPGPTCFFLLSCQALGPGPISSHLVTCRSLLNVVSLATAWMSLEDITLRGISQSQKENTVWFHFCDVPRRVRLVETESRVVVARGRGEEEMGSYYLMRQSFSFVRWKCSGDQLYCIVNILNTTELYLKMDKVVNFILFFIIILTRLGKVIIIIIKKESNTIINLFGLFSTMILMKKRELKRTFELKWTKSKSGQVSPSHLQGLCYFCCLKYFSSHLRLKTPIHPSNRGSKVTSSRKPTLTNLAGSVSIIEHSLIPMFPFSKPRSSLQLYIYLWELD